METIVRLFFNVQRLARQFSKGDHESEDLAEEDEGTIPAHEMAKRLTLI